MNHGLISSLRKGCSYNRNWQMTGRSTAGIDTEDGGPVSAYSDTGRQRSLNNVCAMTGGIRFRIFVTSGAE